MSNLYKNLPNMNEILDNFDQDPVIVKEVANNILDGYRAKIRENVTFNKEDILDDIKKELDEFSPFNLHKVINASGVILHTNLGRAPIPKLALDRINEVSRYYSNLEYNLDLKKRGSRYDHLVKLIKRLTKAEDALIVNNNAAAVFLILNTFAKDKKAIISRGELVEIGGSFRISEIMKESGANIVEVGATNKTHLKDYEREIDEDVAAIVKVHKSNFQMVGYTEEVDTKDLKQMIDDRDILLYEDLGSGSLLDLSQYGFSYEKTVNDCLDDGIDLVSFSCDKLIGSAQAGIIVGKSKYISRLKKNQLLRAFRVGKMTIAAVEATLSQYMDFEKLKKDNPTIRMITESEEDIKNRCQKLFTSLEDIANIDITLVKSKGKIGGGSYPLDEKNTYSIEIKDKDIEKLEKHLRLSDKRIIATIHDNNLYLNALTIFDEQIEDIEQVLREYYER